MHEVAYNNVPLHGTPTGKIFTPYKARKLTVPSAPSNWTNITNIDGVQLKQVEVSGAHVWGLAPDGTVYYRAGQPGSWEKVPGIQLKQITVSGNTVWGLTDDNKMYYRNGLSGFYSGGWKAVMRRFDEPKVITYLAAGG